MRAWTWPMMTSIAACAATPTPAAPPADSGEIHRGDPRDPDGIEVVGVASGRCGAPRAVVAWWGPHRERLGSIRIACVLGDSVLLEAVATPPTRSAGVWILPRAGAGRTGITHWDPYLQGGVALAGLDVVTWSTTRYGTCTIATFAASASTVTLAPCVAPVAAPAVAASALTAPPQPVAVGDTDGDQIVDPADRCPTEPENHDGFEDQDGCPDRRGVRVDR